MLPEDSVISKLEKYSCIESSVYCCFRLLASSQSLTHISPSKMSGCILLLFSSRIRLLALKACSDATVDTGVVRMSRAIMHSVGKRSVLLFHHCKMSSLSSSITKFASKYLTSSVDACVEDDPAVFSFFFKKLHDDPLGPELVVDDEVPYSF